MKHLTEYLMMAVLMALTACSGDDILPENAPHTATVELLIAAPQGARAGDPGSDAGEQSNWNVLALMLAYPDNPAEPYFTASFTKAEFDALEDYNGYKLLKVNAPGGTAYIYGVTYDAEAGQTLAADIARCQGRADVEALPISNAYAAGDAEAASKFLSVATGFYTTDGSTPAPFEVKQTTTAPGDNMPVMLLRRLAAKIDIQWDAQDAYANNITGVRVNGFTFNSNPEQTVPGDGHGRLFPMLNAGAEPIGGSREFYNTTEISKRNGRVYHYVFPDGSKVQPAVTFRIGSDQTAEKDYRFIMPELHQAAWYKVNTTIKGLNGTTEIDLTTI